MKNKNKGFSLIEVIVATSILTIAVFGIFKLIAENSKILTSSNNLMQANFLFQPGVECLNNIGLTALLLETSPVYLNLGDKGLDCSVGDDSYYLNLDNIEYQIYAEKNIEGTDYIDWDIIINSTNSSEMTLNFIQQ